ncbi:MAG: GMC family oxidoreductase [Pseudomonadota bacterium]
MSTLPEQVDYLVVGSGFGGSVAALRLAEKGYSVLVIEAGRRWRPEDFPRSNWNVFKYLWFPLLGCTGIQRVLLHRHFMALAGAGVGGGSLVYAAVLMQPLDDFFRDPQWAHLDDDWKATLAPRYAEARRMLGVTPTPQAWAGDRLLQAYAESIGRQDHFRPTEVGILFGDRPGERVPDPFFDGEGPPRTTCDFSAACMVGCRSGGKNTLDKNYLYLAEKRGARVVPQTLVTGIRPDGQGGYVVESKRSTGILPGRRIWRTKNVVLAAGALGTLELLWRCKERAWLPYLSDALGKKFRTNSEVICGVESSRKDVCYGEGVAIASYLQVNEHTSIESVRYNPGSDVMSALTVPLVPHGSRLTRPLKFLWNSLCHPLVLLRMKQPFGWARRTVILLVMQVLDNSLHMISARPWWAPWRRVLRSHAPQGAPPSFIPEANAAANAIAQASGGTAATAFSEVLLNRPLTAHLLGGCSMAADPEHGVVDRHGRVFGHLGLYVCDGAIVSANLGVNPSLTIAALAEHCMAAVPPKQAAVSGQPSAAAEQERAES